MRALFLIFFFLYTVGQYYLYQYALQEKQKENLEVIEEQKVTIKGYKELLLKTDKAMFDLIRTGRAQLVIIEEQRLLIKKYELQMYYNKRAFYEQN